MLADPLDLNEHRRRPVRKSMRNTDCWEGKEGNAVHQVSDRTTD